MGIQINGATDSITAIDGTIDVVSAIGNAGVVTATAFVGNITGNVTGNINHTSNLELQTGGVTRAHFNSSGHFGIAGITTMSGNLTIENAEPSIFFTDTNGNPDYKIFNDSGALKIYDTTYSATRLQIGPTNGEVTVASNTNFPNGITMNPGTASVVNTIAQKIGDTDTKIRFPAADTFSVETAGSERLRITSAGRVGINETSPDGELHIKGTNPFIYLEGTNGSGRQHKIWSSGTNSESLQLSSGNLLYNGDVHYFRASNETTEYARITSGGKLIVGATAATNGSIAEFSKSVGGGGAGCHITVENTSTNSVNNTAGIHLKTDLGTAKFFKYRAAQTFIQSASGGASELLLQANGAHPMRLYAGDAERVRIKSDGGIYFYGNQTSAPEGDFGFRWDRNSSVDFAIKNTNNTSVNAGARIKLIANIGNIAMHYVNNGGFYLNNSASGYLHYYTGGTSRLYIDTSGNITINNAGTIGTSNGGVGKRLGIKSNANNVIVGETESASNFGLILESRVSGRSGNARSSQIGLGNEVIDFYTAPSGSGVIKRMEIASDGEIKCVGAADNKGFGVYISSTQRVAELIEHSADGELRLYTGNATPLLKTVITSYGSSYINAAGTCRFGVGTSSPSARMHLYDTGTANSNGFRFETGTSGQTAKFVIKTTDNGDESKYLRLSGHWTEVGVHNNEGFRIRNSGNNIAMYMNAGGSYAFSGSNLSDRNLKEDIETISTPTIDLIKKVSPKLFKWKNDTSKTQHGGFIAQEMQPLFPKLISGTDYDESRTDHGDPNEEQGPGNPTGLAFDYDGYTAYLTKAMQELIAKVESLEAEVAALKSS